MQQAKYFTHFAHSELTIVVYPTSYFELEKFGNSADWEVILLKMVGFNFQQLKIINKQLVLYRRLQMSKKHLSDVRFPSKHQLKRLSLLQTPWIMRTYQILR
ncbi:MAG TPA: hypothetical protein PK611_09385 [Saprospiraceae bacterium]|nr:hypothetical protein [Saprospiraceae bacterium]HRP42070.1 hypothetical protein [Saprospiraceae bacterium]